MAVQPLLPVCDESARGKLNLVDLDTGESVSFRALLQGNGKAPGHAIDVEKRQTALNKRKRTSWPKLGGAHEYTVCEGIA